MACPALRNGKRYKICFKTNYQPGKHMKSLFIKLNTTMVILLYPSILLAHHSTAGFFDRDTKIEITGVITNVIWRNPHTVFELDVMNEQGEVTEWHVESGALAVLRAQGLTSEILSVGDQVSILGDRSLRNRPEMFARNILLGNGQEVMLTLGAQHWKENTMKGLQIRQSPMPMAYFVCGARSAKNYKRAVAC
jgi:hypothetical protein